MKSIRTEIFEVIESIWDESCYRFDKQAAMNRITDILKSASDEKPIVYNNPVEPDLYDKLPKNPDGLLFALCAFHEESPDLVKLKSRNAEYVTIRNEFYYIAKKTWPNMKLKEIAYTFKKHHATVLHGIKKIENDKKYLAGYWIDFMLMCDKIKYPIQ